MEIEKSKFYDLTDEVMNQFFEGLKNNFLCCPVCFKIQCFQFKCTQKNVTPLPEACKY